MLLSTAVDKGVSKFDLSLIAGKKACVDFSNLKSVDQPYVQGVILRQIGSCDVMIVKDMKEADYVIEPFCGALSTDSGSWLFGIPSITVPIPLAGPVQTPEVALFKTIYQNATGKFGFRVSEVKTGKQAFSERGVLGRSKYNRYSFIGIPWTITDIPGF
jgi:hypothetical protein